MKCFAKLISDPNITTVVSGTGSPTIESLSELVQETKNDPDLQKEAKKTYEKVEKNFSGLGKIKGKAKIVHLDNKKWSVVVVAKNVIMGLKMTATTYLLPYNDHLFTFVTYCLSKKNCKDVDKKAIEILQPYLLN